LGQPGGRELYRGSILDIGSCVVVRQPSAYRPGASRSGAMNTIISILITFLIIILVLYLINLLPLDGRAKQIVRVIVIVIGVVALLKYLVIF
jgi:hypothetical protein